jgi:hypothetical protein
MSKDPAVLFYTSDFLSGTFTMTNEQVGMYIRLLCFQHQKGKLSEKDMLTICPSRDEEIWGKFDIKDGFYINSRMYEEAEKRKAYCDSRKGNRSKKNICKTYDTTYEKHMSPHMENENENENINEINKINKVINGKKFEYNEVTILPTNYILSIQQQMYIFHHHRIPEDKILEAWEAFRLEKITGQTFYSSEKDIFLHFVNWFKHQKYTPIKTKDNGIDWRTELKNKTLQRLAESKRIDR